MRISLVILALLTVVSSAFAKKDKAVDPAFCQPIFIYGLSTSFKDSVVYLTDVQRLDSAYLEQKKFLGGIKEYVAQLDSYFSKKGEEYRVNTIFFAVSQKQAEKRYISLRKRYNSPKAHAIFKPLPVQDFTFTNVRPVIDSDEKPAPTKKQGKMHDKPKRGHDDGKRPPMGGQGMGPGGMGGPGGGMGPGGMGGGPM